MSDKIAANRLVAYAGIRELTAKDGIKEAFNSARVCSYEGVELLYIASECALLKEQTKEIQAAIKESGLGVKCISCFTDIVGARSPYAPDENAIGVVKNCIDLAASIGSPYVHHTLVTRLSGGRDDYQEALVTVLDVAGDIADYASERGVSILYEPQGMLFNGLDGYSEFFDAMLERHGNVGVCLDVGNTLWVDEDCYDVAVKYAHHVKHVHLKDYVLDSDDNRYRTMAGRTIEEVGLGKGIIDLGRVFTILDGSGYRGYYSIEDNSGTDFKTTAENAHNVLKELIN